jgi:hypothetical protein
MIENEHSFERLTPSKTKIEIQQSSTLIQSGEQID